MSRQAHGLRAWLLQRVTALYILLFLAYLLQYFLTYPVQDFAGWRGWIADPLVNLTTGLFILSILIHAWVGIRDVIMDYVQHTGLRIALFVAVGLTLAGCGLWSLRVLFIAVLRDTNL